MDANLSVVRPFQQILFNNVYCDWIFQRLNAVLHLAIFALLSVFWNLFMDDNIL